MSLYPGPGERNADDREASSADVGRGQLVPLGRGAMPVRAGTGWTSADGERGAEGQGGGFSGYLHALRRRWPVAVVLGVFCAAMAGSAAWFLRTPKYTAVALVQIAAAEQRVLPGLAGQAGQSSFEIYKGTQQQLVTSEVVLVAALRKADVAKLAVIQREQREGDPVTWLAKTLRVDCPPSTEILRVSLTTEDADEAAALVNGVVDAYMNEVVYVEKNRRTERLNDLERLYTEKETEMRSKRTALKQFVEQLGTGDTGALAIKQQIAMQQFAEARSEAGRVGSELRRAQSELLAKQAALKAAGQGQLAGRELDAFAGSDPAFARLQAELDALAEREAAVRNMAAGKLAENLVKGLTDGRKLIEDKMAARRKDLASRLGIMMKNNLEAAIAQLQSQIVALTELERQAAQDLDKQRKIAERFGNSSIDVEMTRAEIQYLDRVLTPVAEERERLKVELRANPRISIFQRAQPPRIADNASPAKNAIVAAILGLLAPLCLIVWWDVRARRVNSLSDVPRAMGLTVIGTVPHVPGKPRRSRALSRRGLQRQTRLEAAVDGIAARLFLRRNSANARVVLVSSALGGEGKTSLATQLAIRLAQTGEPTLLVDFDLRRPSLHEVFGLPRGPGVCEVLATETEFSQTVRETDIKNLSIITAGRHLSNALGTLANGATGSLFERARQQYEFVIVDGSPVLPIADARLASQHVDAVILCIRRDVSQTHKVLAACELLTAFGAKRLLAVLTGSDDEMYYSDLQPLPETQGDEATTH
jgi:capsular exopolysaccharide synthesis family protein